MSDLRQVDDILAEWGEPINEAKPNKATPAASKFQAEWERTLKALPARLEKDMAAYLGCKAEFGPPYVVSKFHDQSPHPGVMFRVTATADGPAAAEHAMTQLVAYEATGQAFTSMVANVKENGAKIDFDFYVSLYYNP